MRILIENEAGSTTKHRYDERTLTLIGKAEVSAAYPFPYGFAIGTRSGDGDAVDCFVLTDRRLASGAVIECEPVGLIEQIEDGETDHKVLVALPGENPRAGDALETLRSFAAGVFAHVPGKSIKLGRLLDREAAEAYLAQCRPD